MGWGVKQMLMSLSQLAHMSSKVEREGYVDRQRERLASVCQRRDLQYSRVFYALIVSFALQGPQKLKCQEINYSLWEISLPVEHFELYQLREHERKKKKRARNIGRYLLDEKFGTL